MDSVNSPKVIATSGISAKLRLTAVPRPEVGAVAFADTLTLHHAATVEAATADNVIFSAPGDALPEGQTIDLGTTSTGLVASAWPAGVAATISWS